METDLEKENLHPAMLADFSDTSLGDPPNYPSNPAEAASATERKPARQEPHSIEAEQSVLGTVLISQEAWDTVSERLTEKDFYRPAHQLIFRAMSMLGSRQAAIDLTSLIAHLKEVGDLTAIGSEAYLYTLANDVPATANIRTYANIVRDRSVLRQLIHVARDIADAAYDPNGRTPAELLEFAEKSVFDISERKNRDVSGPVAVQDLLAKAVDRVDDLFHSDAAITGLPTGFKDFDELTSGLHPADMVVVAGRPSMGKTMFAMNICEYVGLRTQQNVLIFSMEMPGDALAMRMISSLGQVNGHNIRTGNLTDADWPRVSSVIGQIAQVSMFIDDTPALSPLELRSRARRVVKEHGPVGLIMIDYLQLMRVPGTKENRTTEISEISRNIKALAKELNVPIIALSQLNRSLEQRADRRPMMSDLRESGSIEQDADVIVFIYRDEVYNEDSPDKGSAEIIIGKQRNGPIGKVRLTFRGEYLRFENFAADRPQQPMGVF